jgi:hypothetical protein
MLHQWVFLCSIAPIQFYCFGNPQLDIGEYDGYVGAQHAAPLRNSSSRLNCFCKFQPEVSSDGKQKPSLEIERAFQSVA